MVLCGKEGIKGKEKTKVKHKVLLFIQDSVASVQVERIRK